MKVSNHSFKSLLFFCNILFAINVSAAGQGRIAIFQFNAISMNVVGIESEVAYAIRNELSKRNALDIVTQREMEVGLARNDIAQTFDRNEARRTANILSVDYVLIGKVRRVGGKILADVELISRLSKNPIETWVFSFNNQQEIEPKSIEIVDEILSSIQSIESDETQVQQSSVVTWTSNFKAKLADGKVSLNWQLSPQSPVALGFNIYRAEDPTGPFSYVTSVVDNSYQDDISGVSGDIYYQIGLLKEDGEEMRNTDVIKVKKESVSRSTIAAPIVVNYTPMKSGPELEILPSAKNSDLEISSYQLLRRTPESTWLIVDQLKVASGSKSGDITRYKLKDKYFSSLETSATYSVRADANGQLGQMSEGYTFSVPNLPEIKVEETAYLRKINLFWEDVPGSQGYYVHRRKTGTGNWKKISERLAPAVLAFSDTNFDSDGESYDYALSLVSSLGESKLGTPVTWSTKSSLPPPSNLQATVHADAKVLLSWDSDTDPDVIGYRIYRAPYADTKKVMLNRIAEVVWSESPLYDDTEGLDANSHYLYAISAINSFGSEGSISKTIEVHTVSSPDPVTQLNTVVDSGIVKLSWEYSQAEPEHQYLVERSSSDSEWVQLAILQSHQMQYEDNTVSPNTSVVYSISVIDSEAMQSQATISSIVEVLN